MRDKKRPGDQFTKGKDPAVKYADPKKQVLNVKQQSRRDFLEGSGAAVAAGAGISAFGITSSRAQSPDNTVSETTPISVTVNGTQHSLDVQDRWTLAEVLRDQLDLTGTKIGCNRSECGACTVLMDGQPVYACSQLAVWADGASIQTVEGLAQNGELSPVQRAFVENNGPQCGFCTPGMIMRAAELLEKNPNPSEEEIRWGISGNLCRCTGYVNIVKAIQYAAEKMQKEAA